MVVKKVGCVIAYHKGHTNYGTSLVGYALIKEIKNLGYDVEVINYVKQLPFWEKIAWAINAIRCDGFNFISERFIGAKNIKNNPTYAMNIKIRANAVEDYKEHKIIPFSKIIVGIRLCIMALRIMML